MIIKSIDIDRLGPIQSFHADFTHNRTNSDATIVGMNGCGKTFLLNLIATITGNDAATDILSGEKVGFVKLVAEIDGIDHIFEAKNQLIREEVMEFKKTLGDSRSNYGLTEYDETEYIHGSCNYATAASEIKRYFSRRSMMHIFNHDHTYDLMVGDGIKQAIKMFLLANTGTGPLLLDNPSKHVDILGRRSVATMLRRCNRQVILVTHDPEMILFEEDVFSM